MEVGSSGESGKLFSIDASRWLHLGREATWQSALAEWPGRRQTVFQKELECKIWDGARECHRDLHHSKLDPFPWQ